MVGDRYDLVLEAMVAVRPHEGRAHVQVELCNNDSIERCEHSGFQVDFVEFKPITIASERPGYVRKFIVESCATPTFTVDVVEPLRHVPNVPLDKETG